MGVIETKTFKSGNSVAVRLPRELGLEAGASVSIERHGDDITVRVMRDGSDGQARVARLVSALEAIWEGKERPVPNPAEERIEFPDRPGLY